MAVVLALLLFALGAVGGASLVTMRMGPQWRIVGHIDLRSRAIKSRLPENLDIIIVGDSIVEFAPFFRVCGRDTFNSGVAGARISDLSGIMAFVEAIHPKTVVFSAGINDVLRPSGDEWIETLRDWKNRLSNAGVELWIMDLPPLPEKGDKNVYEFINSALMSTSGRNVIKFPASADTVDGLHLTRLGYKSWIESIAQAICR
ncbi:SGNH/GDSL hydrolase family protein [Xanthobacter wiegelii]|uniref:SGNH/GDSL hydrolase family protein n=1 Tax=Xanthobacter wiegelii TaxID=3119913 RepID=UPI003726C9DA